MPFDITQFQNNLQQYGYTSANKFDVQFDMPNFMSNPLSPIYQTLSGYDTTFPQFLQFRAQKVVLPSIALLHHDTYRYGMGPRNRQPYGAEFGDIPMTFLSDNGGLIYQFFTYWINTIYNFSETGQTSGTNLTNGLMQPTYTSAYEDDVVSNSVVITMYDLAGNVMQTINLFRVKPILLVGTPLAWDQTDTLVTLNINFTFREWSISFPQPNS